MFHFINAWVFMNKEVMIMFKDKEYHDRAHEVKDESSAMFNPSEDAEGFVNEEQHNVSNEEFNKYKEEVLTKGHDLINNRLGKQ